MSNTIAFNSPAARWEEALPLGNGRLGAMVFGIPDRERIQLNENSIWSGSYRERNNPAAREALPLVRQLINEKRFAEAEDVCLEKFSGVPSAQRVYQTAGDLFISFTPDPDGGFGHIKSGTRAAPLFTGVRNYRRELDMESSLHTVSFEYNDTIFTRECFIAAQANVLALRLSAKDSAGKAVSGKISFRADLDRGVFCDRTGNLDNAAFLCRDGDIPFCVMIQAVNKGGTLRAHGGFLTVEHADEALLLLDIRTGFREQDSTAACVASLQHAAATGWEKLLDAHKSEARSWYNRMELKLGGGDGGDSAMNGGVAAKAAVRYYNFCRYALFSCSRSTDANNIRTLPANLQGLWNPHMDPPWGSDYTININTQMNYWAVNMCNLAETEQPLFDLLERMYPNGKKTAEVMYGCRGFVAHHNTDIWGDTASRDYWLPASYWTLGAAWLCLHIFEHYEYTLDKKFLEKYFYLLKESCVFFTDFLVPGSRTNGAGQPYLIVSPSSSPENSFLFNGDTATLCAGCEMDNQILRQLFDVTLRAQAVLGIADSDTEKFRALLARIAPPTIHSNGTIREWSEEYEEAEPGHRHFSHLWALYPGTAINADTPELVAAARATIERRLAHSGGHTGWSRAWLVNFMARLQDGAAAMAHLDSLWKEFTLPNLFNNGPPFQIDGNFGALAGMTQMFMQSRLCYADATGTRAGDAFTVALDLLSALPPCWQQGTIRGVRAKGNLELDFAWQGGQITELAIRNNGNAAVTVLLCTAGAEPQELILSPKSEHRLPE